MKISDSKRQIKKNYRELLDHQEAQIALLKIPPIIPLLGSLGKNDSVKSLTFTRTKFLFRAIFLKRKGNVMAAKSKRVRKGNFNWVFAAFVGNVI